MNFSKHNLTPPHIKEAMSLMQSGKLKEATIALQNSLSGQAPDSHTKNSTNNYDHTIRDVTPDAVTQKTTSSTNTSPKDTHNESSRFPHNLQSFADKMKDFTVNLPSSLHIDGVNTHSEPTIPDHAQFIKGTYKSSQGVHDYRLYVPTTYEQAVAEGTNLPLIVMLHGCTQSPEDFAAGTRMNELAEQHRCLVLYPSQPASANQNRCWNWFNVNDQQRGQGEPAWIAQLTQSIIKDYAVDTKRVYIAGLSAGGAMAVIMAEAYPELYAAVGVHSGLAYGSASDLSSALMVMRRGGTVAVSRTGNNDYMPTIVFHGDQDHTVSIRNGNQIIEQAQRRLQSQKTTLNTQQHSQCSEQNRRSTQLVICDESGVSQLEYWKIHGAGHSWAGGSYAGSYTDPTGPDASKEMLRFFLAH